MARRLFKRRAESTDPASTLAERAVWEVRRGRLLACALLSLLAVGFAMQVPVTLPAVLTDQWPALLIASGGALLLHGLVTARATGVLLGPVLVALGLIATLAQQAMLVPGSSQTGGALLLALAAAIVLRGVSFARR